MLATDRIRLLHGPYATPRVCLGAVLFDEARDCEVVVRGLTDASISWPIGIPIYHRVTFSASQSGIDPWTVRTAGRSPSGSIS